MFFLFSDILLYGKPRLLDSTNNSYTCCCVLPLKHCQLETVFGGSKRGAQENTEAGGMFKVCVGHSVRRLILRISAQRSITSKGAQKNTEAFCLQCSVDQWPFMFHLTWCKKEIMMHIFFFQQITCKDESLLLFSNDPEEMKSWTNELDSAIRFNPDVFILFEYLYFINLNLYQKCSLKEVRYLYKVITI